MSTKQLLEDFISQPSEELAKSILAVDKKEISNIDLPNTDDNFWTYLFNSPQHLKIFNTQIVDSYAAISGASFSKGREYLPLLSVDSYDPADYSLHQNVLLYHSHLNFFDRQIDNTLFSPDDLHVAFWGERLKISDIAKHREIDDFKTLALQNLQHNRKIFIEKFCEDTVRLVDSISSPQEEHFLIATIRYVQEEVQRVRTIDSTDLERLPYTYNLQDFLFASNSRIKSFLIDCEECRRSDNEFYSFNAISMYSNLSYHHDIHQGLKDIRLASKNTVNALLQHACKSGNLEDVKMLLTSPDLKHNADNTGKALFYSHEHPAITEYLLTAKDLPAPDYASSRAMLVTSMCRSNYLEALKNLSTHDSMQGFVEANNFSSIKSGAKYPEMIEFLIEFSENKQKAYDAAILYAISNLPTTLMLLESPKFDIERQQNFNHHFEELLLNSCLRKDLDVLKKIRSFPEFDKFFTGDVDTFLPKVFTKTEALSYLILNADIEEHQIFTDFIVEPEIENVITAKRERTLLENITPKNKSRLMKI